MIKVHLPVAKEVRDLLSDLLGKPVSIEPAAPLAPGPKRPATIGVYVDDHLRVAALICFDLPLSAYTAAAIGLVPPAVAEDAVRDGVLSEVLRENLHEVLNIAVGLFNSTPGADHLRLHAMHPAGAPTPQDVLVQALTLGRRTDMRIDVPNYGPGVLSVVQTF